MLKLIKRFILQLKNGAILISDVHYDLEYRKDNFEIFLSKIEKILPPQLLLLGDIFDLLFGGIKYTEKKNRDMILRLDNLGKKIEIIYFEGNHDFNLINIFSNIVIIPISKQPFQMNYLDKKILFSHGDYSVKGIYFFYRRFIQNRLFIKMVNFIDSIIGNIIIKTIEQIQESKQKCYKIESFEKIIINRLKNINSDFFIDGHYHQGITFSIKDISYINLSSFACNQSSFIVKSKQNSISLENISLKEL